MVFVFLFYLQQFLAVTAKSCINKTGMESHSFKFRVFMLEIKKLLKLNSEQIVVQFWYGVLFKRVIFVLFAVQVKSMFRFIQSIFIFIFSLVIIIIAIVLDHFVVHVGANINDSGVLCKLHIRIQQIC